MDHHGMMFVPVFHAALRAEVFFARFYTVAVDILLIEVANQHMM